MALLLKTLSKWRRWSFAAWSLKYGHFVPFASAMRATKNGANSSFNASSTWARKNRKALAGRKDLRIRALELRVQDREGLVGNIRWSPRTFSLAPSWGCGLGGSALEELQPQHDR